MPDQNCIMIYDGECPYCKVASATVENIDNEINIIKWQNEQSQKFLSKLFDDPPFGLVFIDPNKGKVWLGSDACSEITRRGEETKPFSDILSQNYDLIADTVSFLNNREKEIDAYEGVHNMNDEASKLVDELNKESQDTL